MNRVSADKKRVFVTLELSVTYRLRAEHFGIPAIAHQPGQVIPLSGSWFGDAQDYLGMDVNVLIRKLGTLPEFEENVQALREKLDKFVSL